MLEQPPQPPDKKSAKGRPEGYVESGTFGADLRAARKEKGLSAQEFADAIKVERQSVVRWETNKALPTQQALDDINALLGTRLTRPKRTHASKGKPKKKGDTERLLELYALLRRILHAIAPDVPELPEELEPITLDEIIKRVEEWWNRAQGNLQAEPGRPKISLVPQSPTQPPDARSNEQADEDPRILPTKKYRARRSHGQQKKKRR